MDEARLPEDGVSRREIIRRGLKLGGAVYVAPVVLAALKPGKAMAQVTPVPTATAVPSTATAVPPTATAIPPTATAVPFVQCGVSGQAFGAQVTGVGAPLALAPVGLVTLPPGQSVTVASVGVPGIFTTGAITNTAANVSTATQSSATSSSRVDGLTLALLGLLGISATTIQTVSTSTSNRVTAGTSAAGTVFANLLVNGTPIAANPAPNTRIDLPGIGFVIINEQIATGNGRTTAGLTVNGLRLVITTALPLLGLPVGAEVTIASSTSGVNCA